jgi:hypothetical protein
MWSYGRHAAALWQVDMHNAAARCAKIVIRCATSFWQVGLSGKWIQFPAYSLRVYQEASEMTKRDKTKPKNKRSTLRQVALLNSVLLGSSTAKAARKIGYSKKWPDQAGHQALQNPKLKAELLEQLGLRDSALIEKHLKPLLSAERVMFFHHKGKVTDKRIVPDNDTRLKGLDMAFKLWGAYAPTDPKREEPTGVQVILVGIPRPGFPNGRPLPEGVNAQLPAPENRS